MMIHTEKPACWDRLEKQFNLRWESGMIVTYGGEIYCHTGMIAPDFMVHELVHVKQQEGQDPDAYLERYLADKNFRLNMELPAFRTQVSFLRATIQDPEELTARINKLAKMMAKNYGDMVSIELAIILLQ